MLFSPKLFFNDKRRLLIERAADPPQAEYIPYAFKCSMDSCTEKKSSVVHLTK